MSLLLNEDFTLYNLRLGYLQNINDGVGERLITLDPSILANPAFRAAGFVPDAAALKRCYSPPIPTTGAADYFTRPAGSRQARRADGSADNGDGGLLTGRRGSEDTLGPVAISEKEKRRRKNRGRVEEEDSSDLSDDSDEDEEETAAQGVRFAKVSQRNESSASPARSSERKVKMGPEVHVISPSFRPRKSSLSDAVKQATGRPRGDTITSSEFSSDGELLETNAAAFRRKLPSRPGVAEMLASKIAEEDAEDSDLDDEDEDGSEVESDHDAEDEDVSVAEASDLSDEFEGDDIAVPSPDLLGVGVGATISSPQKDNIPRYGPDSVQGRDGSEQILPLLPGLPSGRNIVRPGSASLLTTALKGGSSKTSEGRSFQRFAELSGKGEASPLWIKIYFPFADSSKPMEVPIQRQAISREDAVPTVSDLMGLALYTYQEAGLQPELHGKDLKLSRWELRMMDDGEVEMDFPALNATRPITDFTSNNNRPPQRRARDKPWDEFGLVRSSADASDDGDGDEQEANTVLPTPTSTIRPSPITQTSSSSIPPSMMPSRNRITGPSFHLMRPAERKESSNLMDAPAVPTATFTPRTGEAKVITVHYTDPQSFQTTKLPIETTADTYIADIFDTACARLRLEKALYVLKVRGTQTVAPADRTIEALGANLHLDLGRRRFGAVGDFGLTAAGSPGSTSPNAPLELVPNTPPIARDGKRRKGFNVANQQPTLQQHGRGYETVTTSTINYPGAMTGRRYNVLRKMPLSFSASHPRTLIITPEFLQIMGVQAEDSQAPAKVTNIHMSSIIGAKVSHKHPKMARVVVYREKEAKRYDFECASNTEAEAIVADVRVGMGEYGGGLDDGQD